MQRARLISTWMLVGLAHAALCAAIVAHDGLAGGRPQLAPGVGPLFVENRGQFGEVVRFRTALPGNVATVTDEGLVLTQVRRDRDGTWRGHNVRLRFELTSEGARSAPSGHELARTRTSYFIGDDPAAWITDVPTWTSLRFGDASGPSVEVHGRNGYLEYDLRVPPGLDASVLEVVVEGADRLLARADGSLDLETPLGTIRQLAPRTWEIAADGARSPLASRVEVLEGERLRFHVEGRDLSRPLVVDPGLIYSTFIGTDGPEVAHAIAADVSGAAYVVGRSGSGDFPVTPGAFQPEKAERGTWLDVVALKLSADGSSLVYATYLGGTGDEEIFDAVVDEQGQLLIVGATSASDYPTTAGCYSDEVEGDADDGFATVLNADGTDLVASTLFGGSGGASDGFVAVTRDALGRIVLAGVAVELDLPLTPTAIQTTVPDPPTGFLARFSPDLTALDYCTYVGSTDIRGLATDADSAIYAAGYGHSLSGLPTTPGAYQEHYAGSNDAFVLKLAPDGTLAWCSNLGGGLGDRAFGLGVDAQGRPIVSGWTESFDFPTTEGAFDTFFGGANDRFVARFSADGSALEWSTLLGGADFDQVGGFAVDAEGASYIATDTRSPDMPVTPNGFDTTLNENLPPWPAIHVAKLSPDGSELLYGSFLGGTGFDIDDPRDMAIDPQGNIYVTGYTSSADFPVTPGAYDTELSGFSDWFVAKFDLSTWTWLDAALPPLSGPAPRLTAAGSLQPFSAGSMHVDRARPNALCTVVIGLSSIHLPFKGGVMVPAPDRLLGFFTDGDGELHASWDEWPPLLPEGLGLWFQAWVQDPDSYLGYAASNGLTATIPAAD